MRAAFPILAAFAALAGASGVLAKAAPAGGGVTKGVANAVLIAHGMATPLKLIDYDQVLCRNERTIAAWLKDLGPEVAAVTWTGGPCQLSTDASPLDSGSDWCAQANIRLKHPRNRQDRPMVEIYFDKPRRGVPSPAYAFRGFLPDKDGEVEAIRFRRDFEAVWEERFPASKAALDCPEA
jgi:hypothetical protein